MQSFEVLEQAYEAKRKKDLLSNIFYGVASLLIILLAIFIYQQYRSFTLTQQLTKQNIAIKPQNIQAVKTPQPKKVQTVTTTAQANTQQTLAPQPTKKTQEPTKQQAIQAQQQAPQVAQKQSTKIQDTQAKNPVQQDLLKKQKTTIQNTVASQAKTVQSNTADTVKPNKQALTNLEQAKPKPTMQQQAPQAKKVAEKPKPPAFSLSIKTNTKITTAKLIQRFNNEKNYKNAMKIADAFFINKNYQKASDWALRANNLDKYQERSWLLFAKAQVSLNNIEVAKAALESFLRMRNSERILLYYKKISR